MSVLLVWRCGSSVTPGPWWGGGSLQVGGGQVLAARGDAAWQGVPISVAGICGFPCTVKAAQ